MKSLESIIASENSAAVKYYALTRCGALYSAFSGLLLARPGTEAESERMQTASAQTLVRALVYAIENNLNQNADTVGDQAVAICDLYFKRWRNNQAATGHNLGEMTKSDSAVCKQLLEGS